MIAFDLQCECGLFFEGWFKDHDDFENQVAEGLLSCPQCGVSHCIRKILSPVMYSKSSTREVSLQSGKSAVTNEENLTRAVENTLRNLQQFVEHNFEDVGAEFAVKSLKIHYGNEEPKNIRGVVTEAEEDLLRKEGIDFLKIPLLNKNDENKH
ncbi:MAG: DUF1178 family protein [Pseudomonadota bacterium]